MRNMNLPSILALSPHIPFFLLPSPVVSVQDASRLVFASVQGARPRRKVAIPIVDDMTWSAFVAVLRSKLHLDHVGAVHLVNTGVQVTSLDQLEDIDELIVDPNPTTSQSNPNAEPATNPSSSSSDHPSSRSSVPLSSPSARVGPLGPSASTRPVPSVNALGNVQARVARTGSLGTTDNAVGVGGGGGNQMDASKIRNEHYERDGDEGPKYARRSSPWGMWLRRVGAALGLSGGVGYPRERDVESLVSPSSPLGPRRVRRPRRRPSACQDTLRVAIIILMVALGVIMLVMWRSSAAMVGDATTLGALNGASGGATTTATVTNGGASSSRGREGAVTRVRVPATTKKTSKGSGSGSGEEEEEVDLGDVEADDERRSPKRVMGGGGAEGGRRVDEADDQEETGDGAVRRAIRTGSEGKTKKVGGTHAKDSASAKAWKGMSMGKGKGGKKSVDDESERNTTSA